MGIDRAGIKLKEAKMEETKMKSKTTPAIWIGKNAYLFLWDEERKQRGCSSLSQETKEKIWKRVKRSPNFRNGQYRVTNDSFGGGDGTYDGRWWSWSVETIIKMLEDNDFKYRK